MWLYLANRILLLSIGFILLFSIAKAAVSDSWYYLLLYAPLLLYYYGLEPTDYGKKKHTHIKGKDLKW